MTKLQGAQSYVYSITDKLGPVREAMAQKDDNWEEWGLEELVENLRKYTHRNPYLVQLPQPRTVGNQGNHLWRKESMPMSSPSLRQPRQLQTPPACVYCNSAQDRSSEYTKVRDPASRREFLKRNNLCYNNARSEHAAFQCMSRGCGRCNSRHHFFF